MAKRVTNQALQERLSRSFKRIPAEDIPRVFRLRLSEIEPNPDQPRKHIDREALAELAASIERHGLIQPITVQRRDGEDRYVLVAGERRFRAHELLGREEILAIVTNGAADEIALIENIQREDLHPLEEAAAFARMMQAHGWTQEQLAEIVGKARPTVTNTLKLNGLADSIKAECGRRTDISKSLLFEIARQETHKEQEQLWAKLRAGGTVRAARASSARRAPAGPAPDPAAAVVATGRRLLEQIAVLDSRLRASEKSLRHDLTALRRELEIVVGKLARLPAARAAE